MERDPPERRGHGASGISLEVGVPPGPVPERRILAPDPVRGLPKGITLLHNPTLRGQPQRFAPGIFQVGRGRTGRIDHIGLTRQGVDRPEALRWASWDPAARRWHLPYREE